MKNKNNIYFLGIGGIGMSALARYFNAKGFSVAGYDRVESALTIQLQEEGIDIHYDDNVELIPNEFMDKDSTLVVYTPAIPNTLIELNYFKECDFTIMKRSQVLGEITRMWKGICVAGTHGKTTTSTMTAHLLHNSHVDCNAFIGGISNNFKQNIHLSEKSDLVVIEADEYDRSFLTLNPYVAIITSVDADHLDIYNDESDYRATFEKFTSLIVDNGILLMKKDLPIKPKVKKNVTIYTYSANDNDADFYAINVRIEDGNIDFDLVTPTSIIENIRLGVPVSINIENGIAAMAVALLNGVTEQEVKDSMASYAGVKRRFDFHIKNEDIVLIDDYAHHPEELKACISSVRALYPNKKITGIFQPHLFTRTRDFADEFAQNLSKLDEIILLDIYPAREMPIEGVNSEMILSKIENSDKIVLEKQSLLNYIDENNFDVLLTIGAGDIELLIPKIKKILLNKRIN